MGSYVWLVLVIVLVLSGAYAGYRIKKGIRSFSRSVFGTDSLSKGLEAQAVQLSQTPKSVSGMTKIYLPQINEDFPQFNYHEFKQKAEQQLEDALYAVSLMDTSRLTGVSPAFLQQVQTQIEERRSAGEKERYQSVHIHRTEITAYVKKAGTCMITLQSAVEHVHYVENTAGEIVSGRKDLKEQTKYNSELLYIQDIEKAKAAVTAVGVTCPNCGAPVTNLGIKKCSYCGAEVMELNIQVWMISRFYEVTK